MSKGDCTMMMDNEQLGRALGDITDTVVELQRNIDHVRQLFSASVPRRPCSSPTSSNSHSSHGRSISQLERRVEELESSKRDLTDTLSTIQDEVYNAVRAREDIMKRYRLLIRSSASLLQRMIQDFPDEEYDDELRSTVKEDLKRSLRSSSSGTPRSNITARPESRVTNRSFVSGRHSLEIPTHQVDPTILLHQDRTPEDSDVAPWFIHNGTRIPVSVKYAAGPLSEDSFIQLGIEKNQLEDLFLSLIHPNDVSIRLAMLPSPLGLESLKLVFLYDPFYLESKTGSYILDWATPQTKKKIARFIKDNTDRDGSAVFQTFTYSKKKKQWYYFGSLGWTLDRQSITIWPTLDNESRSSILKKLSGRSHGSVVTGEVEKQITDGKLKELAIGITSAGSKEVMREIAMGLGQQLKGAKVRMPQ